ncbi:MAG: LuxR C-terminal-related transcriptional regulator [Marivita sp.]|uniref:response regulator transcription factor n=1 Tax=Marivita sp. TaxID=2003365 RepID=UPI003EF6FA61
MISVAILEDNLILRNRIASIVNNWDLANECHSFDSNTAFISNFEMIECDIALVDLNLVDGSGIRSIQYISESGKSCKSIVISALSDADTIMTAILSGAVGYLHKDDSSIGVIAAIEMVLQGESPISSAIARKVLSRIQNKDTDQRNTILNEKRNSILTPKELEVLALLSKGLSYSEAAHTLGMSSNTVPVHIRKIYSKLQVNSKSEAVYEARQLGLLP